MAFDPDKYLTKTAPQVESEEPSFDPDAFLQQKIEESPESIEEMAGIPTGSTIEEELLAGTVDVPKSETVAALRGAVQEGTFGLADELGAGISALTSSPKDIKSLVESYKASRDKTRKENKELEEMFPKSYLAGQVVGGVLPAVMTGGAGVAAQAAKQGGKALAKLGAKTGLVYGAAQGVGRSEAELLEGELGKFAQDVGSEAALGGAVGGILPLVGTAAKGVGSKAGEVVKRIPGVESGYKLGKEGISNTYESLMKEFRGVSKNLSNKIREGLKKEGVAKAEALELADAIGISLNAGDPVDTAIEKAMNLKNVPEAERARFTTFLQKLVGEDPDLDKQIAKLDQLRAKQIEKASREGFELEGTEQIGKRIEDIVPDSSIQGTLVGTEDVLKKTAEDGQEVTKKLLNLQTLADDLNLPDIDVQDLSPTQMEDLIKQVNKFANPGKKTNPTEVEVVARNLAGELRKLANVATQGTSVQGANKNIAALLDAIKQSGMKGKVSSNLPSPTEGVGARFLREEQERQLQKKLMDASQFGDVDVESLFSRLKEVDPKFSQIEERTRLLKDAMTIAQSGEGSASTSARALIGGAQKMAALASNVAGKTVKKLEGANPSKVLLETGKAVREATPQSIQNLLTKIEGTAAYKSFVPALQSAANATTDASRKLIMFGLHQQPAFREMLRAVGAGADQKASDEFTEGQNQAEMSTDEQDTTSMLDSAKGAVEAVSDSIIPKAAAASDMPEENYVIAPEYRMENLKKQAKDKPKNDQNLPRGIRNNNPGNIDFNKKVEWQGMTGKEKQGRFATFDTPESGIRAMGKLLKNYNKMYNLNTLPELINRWAPPVENDTKQYIRQVSKMTGISPDMPLDFEDSDTMLRLLKAMITMENGQQPYTDEQILRAIESID